MKRADLEHVVRAAGKVAEDTELIVVGSQSILGQFADPPAALLVSMEAGLWPRNHPDRADDIDGAIGEGSPFHDSYGYYAQGVGPETAILPDGWEARLVALRTPATNGVTAWCLEVHDLAVAKLVAGRDKDLRFVTDLARYGMVARDVLEERARATRLDAALAERLSARIARCFPSG